MNVKRAIEDKNAALRSAYNRGDAASCVAVFLEDAVMLPPNRPISLRESHDDRLQLDQRTV
jgi:ketosteroid isomerase-like protein